ncbi:efflux RND transporter periplasmic adaptor subunit [Halobacillus litoralis]|uniref:efflux RND transporter periplasmic adaptor subunit n=1 Tax=Halobacillus litoralis TaxID=45668 RepID=UPI0024928727|nr:efflux RND transporter periplasmic adaptor subunit [Halobacillus litoralis]
MAKKNYKGRIIGLLIVAFITTNALLIFFDDKEKVDRKSYINEWSRTITYDLFEKLQTRGVFTSEESSPVYFNEETGSFGEFLVKEGDSVSEGDDLYTYEVENYYQQEANLQGEISRLEEEIGAIEDYIDEVEDYTIPDPPQSENDSAFGSDDSEETPPPSYVETEFLKEEKIAEKEKELAKQEAMLEMVEDQLDQLQDNGDQITVTSTFSGTVTHISEELEAPLLTLESRNLVLEGELREGERKDVEEGMSAEISVPDLDVEATGTLESVDEFPEDMKVHRSSRYPYSISLDDANEELLPGYHADVKLITDEALGVVTSLETALETDENLYAWVMNAEGQLERREIESGLEENGLVEIVSGLEEGEWLAIYPKDEFRDDATFFTPLKIDEMPVQDLFKIEQKSMITYGLLGIMSR